jgi:hypothetical protein
MFELGKLLLKGERKNDCLIIYKLNLLFIIILYKIMVEYLLILFNFFKKKKMKNP